MILIFFKATSSVWIDAVKQEIGRLAGKDMLTEVVRGGSNVGSIQGRTTGTEGPGSGERRSEQKLKILTLIHVLHSFTSE